MTSSRPRLVATSVALSIIGIAVLLRIALGLSAPAPFGYVYDLYHEPIVLLHETGKLPDTHDCWQCYHPPLFTLVGHSIYTAGLAASGNDQDTALQFLAWFTTIVSLVFLGVCFLIMRRFIDDRKHLAALSAILVSLPCVFFASFSVESDLFCSTLMLGAFYLYLRYAAIEDHAHWRSFVLIIGMGLLAGLAALTKYSGLVIVAVLGVLFGFDLLRHFSRHRLAHVACFGAVVVLVGSAPYVENYRERGELIRGNRAWQQISGKHMNRYFDLYEFDTFHIGRLIDLMRPDAERGELKRFPVYNSSVLSSHYGQIYTDCSIFSNPTRHGLRKGLYPQKNIPVFLVAALLGAGLIPVVLGIAGLGPAIAQSRAHLPFFVLAIIFLGLYTNWFLSYPEWMLKTKYSFCLVPFALVLCGRGLGLAQRIHPRLEQFFIAALWLVAALSTAYGFFFALT